MNIWGPIAGAVATICWGLGVWVMFRFVVKPHSFKEVRLDRIRERQEPRP